MLKDINFQTTLEVITAFLVLLYAVIWLAYNWKLVFGWPYRTVRKLYLENKASLLALEMSDIDEELDIEERVDFRKKLWADLDKKQKAFDQIQAELGTL